MRARILSAVLFLIAVAAQPCPLTAPAFARIDGIPGDSNDQCHREEIRLLVPPTRSGSTMTIVKSQDAATPSLIQFAAIGRHISRIRITTFTPSNMNATIVYTLEDVLVTGVEVRAGNVNREEVTLTFAKLTTETRPDSVTAPASLTAPPLPAQLGSANLSSFRFSLWISGGKPEFSAATSPSQGQLPDNTTLQIKTGRFTWSLIGAKTAPAGRASKLGSGSLQFDRFRIFGTTSAGAKDFTWDIKENKAV
jgi:type VI protein secretion system component Hcp